MLNSSTSTLTNSVNTSVSLNPAVKKGVVKRSLSLRNDQERPFMYIKTRQPDKKVESFTNKSGFAKICEKEGEKEDEKDEASASVLVSAPPPAVSDPDNSLNTVKTRFISKIYTKYECLPFKH